MTTALGDTLSHSYDGLRRLSSVTNGLLTRQYSYRDISDNLTTMQVSRVRYPEFNYNFDYTYDALGNIATYDSPWANPVTYTYDNQSQLLSASDGTTTYTYTYDAAGNIQSASNGTTTHSYTYGDADWKDLLTAFDNQSITYDASGNPTSYFNGKRWTMSWANGRQLASASDGTSTYSYIYDAAGSRIMKNVGTVNHLYFYVNGMLLMEYRYNAMGDTTDVLQYFYDANGNPHAMAYNGTVYLYVTNLQGDIVALLGLDGTVSGYEYDPYGNVIASYGDIAAINPLRYRGYYYDNETGLYYLQSRYYDPVVGRFINADEYVSTGQGLIGCNMFAYCNNNPSLYTDSAGSRPVAYTINGEEPEDAREWSYEYMNSKTSSETETHNSSISCTVSAGVTFSYGTGFWTYSGQVAQASDLTGNSELQATGGAVLSPGRGFSISGNIIFTNAPGIEYLHGMGHLIGFTYNCIGVDMVYIPKPENPNTAYIGFALSYVYPPSYDVHYAAGYTVPLTQNSINIFDLCESYQNFYWEYY